MKKLLAFDKPGFEADITSTEQTATSINELIEKINSISKLRVNDELYQLLTAPDRDSVLHELAKNTIAMMEKAGIYSQRLQRDAVEDAQNEFMKLWPELHAMATSYRPELRRLTFKNGKVILTDQAKKELEESHKSYLSSDKASDMHAAHQAVADALNNFCALSGVRAWQLPALLFQSILENTGDDFKIRPLNYDHMAAQQPA